MRYARYALMPLLAAAALTVADAQEKSATPPKGFTSLFNGKDLDGWRATGDPNAWSAEGGMIVLKRGGGGWLMTEKEYGDFELRLEYRMAKMGNSGVALRSPLRGDPAYVGMEIQLIDDGNWPRLAPYQHTGSIYGVVPASKVVTKGPGEWNQVRIVCKGRNVAVEVNGTKVVDADLDQYKREHAKAHPGILRKSGHVGLQSYNVRVDFRNIWIKPL